MSRQYNILVIGLGLIGGSLARAAMNSGFAREVVGYGYRDTSLKRGVELGIIDRYSLDLDEALVGVDIVFIATPTLVASEMLEEIMPRVATHTVVTDAASVKGSLQREALRLWGKMPANLVLGHPIAGSEQSGVEASRADLFQDHRVILTPTEETSSQALQIVREMWSSCGADVVEMTVAEHDAILAATSHLPHVLAYTLVDALAQSEKGEAIFEFAAGGFRDFTRIASSDPVMWRDITLANRDKLLEAIDSFTDHLGHLRAAVAAGESDELLEIFTRAKASRDEFAALLAQRNSK